MAIINKLQIHGDKTADSVVEKILRSLTTKYNFVVCAIEEANDLDEITLDELESSILVHQRKFCLKDSEGEQALKVSTQNQPSSFNGSNRGRDRVRGRGNDARGNQHQNNTSRG
nr:Retrovirus-related Pol polyprotein from transposon TNT 1-94 [Ipomoea batatas]GMD72652.1 Retrovirus-related Pol polyprotein from transposon TNT 1-94 [Ipomoea batatas]